MSVWEAILVAVSLCADCFACTLCSGVSLTAASERVPSGGDGWGFSDKGQARASSSAGGWRIAGIALVFAVIQSGLLLSGWGFGNLLVGFVQKISHWIGFLLLLYVGGSMLLEGVRALRGPDDLASMRLDGFKNVVLSGIATSIDALGVGVSQSMVDASHRFASIAPLFAAVFVVTALSVLAGLLGGRAIGHRFGHWAEIFGGLVLIGIGVSFLL
ncbi:MAG: manganese efflux pump [Bacteroidales bacterium]|nr:manganese efflux pump [Bacteroidales bacterium]